MLGVHSAYYTRTEEVQVLNAEKDSLFRKANLHGHIIIITNHVNILVGRIQNGLQDPHSRVYISCIIPSPWVSWDLCM